MPLGERPMFERQRETMHERGAKFRETGWYPEMVWFFRHKYNSREESARDFIQRQKSHHVRFLKKRGWDEESINLAWTEIMASLAAKQGRFDAAVEALRASDRNRRRRYKIDKKHFKD